MALNFLNVGVSDAVTAVGGVLDELFTSDEEKLDKQILLERLRQQPNLAQIALNQTEAQHRTVFVAGWRPFIGWVCGTALAYNFIVRDLMAWLITVYSPWREVAIPPALEVGPLMTVLLALLGLGGFRTVEKLKGKAK